MKSPGRYSKLKLSILNYTPKAIGNRVLSCGEGEQLGHPGRRQTRKPRAVDTFPEGTKFVQVVAGGVHSLVLTENGQIYSCGINEKGTVPVKGLELEEVTDEFTEIVFEEDLVKLGKIVQVAAGASFSAALTEKGSVIVWGNLRDIQGDLTVHQKTLNEMQKNPVVIIKHSVEAIVKIAAGENHLAMLSVDGEVLTFGEGSVGQLGRSSRPDRIRSSYMADTSGKHLKLVVRDNTTFLKFKDVFACGYWTIAKTLDGRLFACGLNNFHQLGVMQPLTRKTRGRQLNMTLNSTLESSMNDSKDSKTPDTNNESKTKDADLGTDEGSKITNLTHTTSFPSESNWTHIAGVQHIVCRNSDGDLYGIGKNTDNALGIGTWEGNNDNLHWRYDSLQKITFPDNQKIAGVDASLGTSIAWTPDGKVFAFGCDTVGQLGLGIKDDEDKVVPTPRPVHSAHLDGYRVLSVSLADNHALFLATNLTEQPRDDTTNIGEDETVEQMEIDEKAKEEPPIKQAKVDKHPAKKSAAKTQKAKNESKSKAKKATNSAIAAEKEDEEKSKNSDERAAKNDEKSKEEGLAIVKDDATEKEDEAIVKNTDFNDNAPLVANEEEPAPAAAAPLNNTLTPEKPKRKRRKLY